MFNLDLKTEKYSIPYDWMNLVDVFNSDDKAQLASSYPTDNYRTISLNATNRQYNYDVRALVSFEGKIQNKELLSAIWAKFAEYLISKQYKEFIASLTGIDVSELPVEANIYKYAKNCFMDAHQDLNTKVLTQVIYFNEEWDDKNGGCLNVLNSKDIKDVYKKISPIIGNSTIIVRSDKSWHSVDITICDKSRRSVTIVFYKNGSKSPMWMGEKYKFHDNQC